MKIFLIAMLGKKDILFSLFLVSEMNNDEMDYAKSQTMLGLYTADHYG